MTRFARAKGSKSSNEKKPEEATSWSEMKKGMVPKTKPKESKPEEKEVPEEKMKIDDEPKETEWASLGGDTFDESVSLVKKHLGQTVNTSEEIKKVKKKRKKSKDSQTELHSEKKLKSGKEDKKTKIKPDDVESEVKIKSKIKPDDVESEVKIKSKIKPDDVESEVKIKKKEKKRELVESDDDVQVIIPKKKKKKLAKMNREGSDSEEIQILSDGEGKNKKPEKNNDDKKLKNNKDKKFQSKDMKKDKRGNLNQKMQGKQKEDKKFKHKNLKEKKSPVEELFINGKKIPITKFQGFYVTVEDAERLKRLRAQMIKQGISKERSEAAIKLERRRSEKALSKLKKAVCFHCRSYGHLLSNCPKLPEKENTGTGICYKCGSTEHSAFICKVVKGTKYQFAECFICKEQGHIARQCPDNPRGLYPQGGACRECGDVTHLRKDCPKIQAQKAEEVVTVGLRSDRDLECLDEEIVGKEEQDLKNKVKRNLTVKF